MQEDDRVPFTEGDVAHLSVKDADATARMMILG
jgi:hypothetical protein